MIHYVLLSQVLPSVAPKAAEMGIVSAEQLVAARRKGDVFVMLANRVSCLTPMTRDELVAAIDGLEARFPNLPIPEARCSPGPSSMVTFFEAG